MAVTEHGGAQICYEDRHGRQPEGRGAGGPPVLLVHGGLHERMDAGRFWVAPGVADGLAGEPRPGLAFGVALTLDPLARESFERLDAAEGASLLRRSGRSLLAGETVRGATDRELRSLAAAHLGVRVIAPASDGPTHSRAVAERLAGLTGAEPPAAGFPETPRPDFAAAREPFQTALLGLLASMGWRERPWGPEATPPSSDAVRPAAFPPGATPPSTASGR